MRIQSPPNRPTPSKKPDQPAKPKETLEPWQYDFGPPAVAASFIGSMAAIVGGGCLIARNYGAIPSFATTAVLTATTTRLAADMDLESLVVAGTVMGLFVQGGQIMSPIAGALVGGVMGGLFGAQLAVQRQRAKTGDFGPHASDH